MKSLLIDDIGFFNYIGVVFKMFDYLFYVGVDVFNSVDVVGIGETDLNVIVEEVSI